MATPPRIGTPRPGGYRVGDIKPGDPYEISGGELIECLPAGPRHGRANLVGGTVLDSDPAVESAGVDVGFAPSEDTLRAPDISVGVLGEGSSWVKGAPPLAVEYADVGQNAADLRRKVTELQGGGCRYIWVVWLTGARRVEVYEAGQPMRLAFPGQDLTAPGVLQNPVPVNALYDRGAAQEATLRNLLNRKGYQSLEHVEAKSRSEGWNEGRNEGRTEGRSEGWSEGREEGRVLAAQAVLAVLRARGLTIDEALEARVRAEPDLGRIETWLRLALTVTRADALLE